MVANDDPAVLLGGVLCREKRESAGEKRPQAKTWQADGVEGQTLATSSGVYSFRSVMMVDELLGWQGAMAAGLRSIQISSFSIVVFLKTRLCKNWSKRSFVIDLVYMV
eukprot:scaffold8935_cov199-Ochromonas_danica.AAC.1